MAKKPPDNSWYKHAKAQASRQYEYWFETGKPATIEHDMMRDSLIVKYRGQSFEIEKVEATMKTKEQIQSLIKVWMKLVDKSKRVLVYG